MENSIVVWDPTGKFGEGTIISRSREQELRAFGCATLPCRPELFSLTGASGYSRRAWGAGWPLNEGVPKLVCPLAMFVAFGAPRSLEWCARLIPDDQALARVKANQPAAQGFLRLASMEQRGTMMRAAVVEELSVDVSNLRHPDAHGGYTVYGRVGLHVQTEQAIGLGLYGFAPGMRVQWLAATLTT